MKCDVSISPYKSFYKSAIAISFDYETTANSARLNNYSLIKRIVVKNYIKLLTKNKNLSSLYGKGYTNRVGAENILNVLMKHGIHGTWFCTGHVLLKENHQKDAFRIKSMASYEAIKKGWLDLGVKWQEECPVFFKDPYSNYKKYPYWYFGDQTEKLRLYGEDIQCHSSSHPYVPLEAIGNLEIDLEDWQTIAQKNGFKKATIFSFPFSGDIYKVYPDTKEKAIFRELKHDRNYHIKMLSNKILNILESNGIELLTRCGSKNRESLQGPFHRYGNSNLNYMYDVNVNPAKFDFVYFKKKIENCINNEVAINIWMHPHNVFTDEEVNNFELIVRILLNEQQQNKIWLTTISDIWEHYKKCKLCKLNMNLIGKDIIEATIYNKSYSAIENVGVDFDKSKYKVLNLNDGLAVKDNKVRINKIYPRTSYTFTFKIIDG